MTTGETSSSGRGADGAAAFTSTSARKAATIKKEKLKLNFLLMGKTGNGKSSTGNAILNRDFFKRKATAKSVTKEVTCCCTVFESYKIWVVDTPGLMDTDMSKAEDTKSAAKHMDQALAKCYGGVDAFLLVLKFTDRFTKAEQDALDTLKRIFGDNYISHLIVVMTYGDLFWGEMEEDNRDISFQEWCEEQRGEIEKLYQDCNGRFVLFNNKEKNEEEKKAQTQEIINLAEELTKKNGRYNSECFNNARIEREKLILEKAAPQLTEEIQEKISLLTADIEKLCTLSRKCREKIEHRIENLQTVIRNVDTGPVTVDGLCGLIERAKRSLSNTTELQCISSDLKDMMKIEEEMTAMGHLSDFLSFIVMQHLILVPKVPNFHEESVKKEKHHVKVEGKKFNFLLIGNSHAITSGNFGYDQNIFRTWSTSLKSTQDFVGYTEFENYVLKIVNIPVVTDKSGNISADNDKSVECETKTNIFSALIRCSEGADAFLFTTEFSKVFTTEDRSRLDAYKKIFGDLFLDHVIIVMMEGDLFLSAMKEEGRNITFQEWCKEQTGEMQKLYQDCNGRFVLFNNREKSEARNKDQIRQIVQIAEDLRADYGRYTSRAFENCEFECKKLIIEHNKPQLIEDIQEQICLLIADIEMFSEQYCSERETIKEGIEDLRNEIEVQDKGYGVLGNLKTLVKETEQHLDNTDDLTVFVEKMEEIRQATPVWNKIGEMCKFVQGTWILTKIKVNQYIASI